MLIERGLRRELAEDYAARLADTIEEDADGKWVIRDDSGRVIDRIEPVLWPQSSQGWIFSGLNTGPLFHFRESAMTKLMKHVIILGAGASVTSGYPDRKRATTSHKFWRTFV